MRRVRSWVPFVLLLAGCGGGGSSPDGRTRVTIAWPDTTRAFTGSALSRSAIVRFENAVTGDAVASTTVVRPEGTSSTTKRYTLPQKITPGTYVLKVLFCVGTDAQTANVVGFGSTSATVRSDGGLRGPDGKGLGDIAFVSDLASLAVGPNQSVGVGQKTSLQVSATTQGGGVVAVPFAAVTYTVTNGGSSLRANDDGTVTGLTPGTATVVAKAYGVTSAPQAVSVAAGP